MANKTHDKPKRAAHPILSNTYYTSNFVSLLKKKFVTSQMMIDVVEYQ